LHLLWQVICQFYVGLLFLRRKIIYDDLFAPINHFYTYSRQLLENYRRKSGDGLSMTFLVIWLAGDVFNLLGVIMQNLLVTMVTNYNMS
jgi:hypothetical protein